MIFQSVEIHNFLSIGSVKLSLHNQGLVLLNGKNLDNNSLNNNGAGKSSILEAIVYALYGRTLRGLKGDAVIHRLVGKGTSVFLDLLDDDGTPYRIARYRKHPVNKNKSLLYRAGVDITPKSESDFDEYITRLLQADYTTFTASLLYSAESFKFSTATDSEIKKTFDTMLDLDVLSRALELNRSYLRDTNKDLSFAHRSVDGATTRLKELRGKIEQAQISQRGFESDRAAKLQHLQESIASLQEKVQLIVNEQVSTQHQIDETEKDYNDADKAASDKSDELRQVDDLKDELNSVGQELNAIDLKVKTCNNTIDNNNREISRLKKTIAAAQIKIDKLENKKQELMTQIGQPCPTCGAPLTAEKIEPARVEYDRNIAEIQDEIDDVDQSIQKLQSANQQQQSQITDLEVQSQELMNTKSEFQRLLAQCKGMEDERDAAISKRDKLMKRLYELRLQLQTLNGDLSHNQFLLQQLRLNLEDTMELKNPYDAILTGLQSEETDEQSKLKQANSSIIELKQREDCLKFWEGAFSNRGIKSLILDDITPFLNRRVNRYLSKLAAGQIEATFSTRSTLKSGGESERFSLTITNSDGGSQYSANSGGEKKRIDLAINLALQDLVASRSSKKIDIAIFDEVFDALDENGIDSVVSLLQELSKEKSTILVVTHNEHLRSYFENCITVVKDNGFSYLLEDKNEQQDFE